MRDLEWSGRERVLDIGCGKGLQTHLISMRCGRITGIDIDADALHHARRLAMYLPRCRVDHIPGSLESIGFPDSSFDRIFSICVLEHIANYEEVLRECLRILMPGGDIVFSVDTLENIEDVKIVEKHRREHHVVQYFREDTIHALLENTGFTDIRSQPLFRSEMARELFLCGIRQGSFNSGLKTSAISRKLSAAEALAPGGAKGIFLLVRAKKAP